MKYIVKDKIIIIEKPEDFKSKVLEIDKVTKESKRKDTEIEVDVSACYGRLFPIKTVLRIELHEFFSGRLINCVYTPYNSFVYSKNDIDYMYQQFNTYEPIYSTNYNIDDNFYYRITNFCNTTISSVDMSNSINDIATTLRSTGYYITLI